MKTEHLKGMSLDEIFTYAKDKARDAVLSIRERDIIEASEDPTLQDVETASYEEQIDKMAKTYYKGWVKHLSQ